MSYLQKQIDKGESLINDRQFEQANAHFEKLLASHDNEVGVYAGLIKNWLVQENLEKSERILNLAINKFPKNAVIQGLYGSYFLVKKNYSKALSVLKKSIDLDENNALNYCNLAIAYKESGYLEQAERAGLKSIELNPKQTALIYFKLGEIYQEQNEDIKAATKFLETVNMDPYYFKSYMNLVEIFRHNKRNNLVVGILQVANKVFPDIDAIALELANSLFEEAKYKDALELYLQLIKKEDSYELRLKAAITYTALADMPQAMGEYQKAIEINDQRWEAFYNIAEIYGLAGNAQEAIKYYDKAIASLEEPTFEPYNGMGAALIKDNQYEKAIEFLLKAHEFNSLNVAIMYNLGLAFANLDNNLQNRTIAKQWFASVLRHSKEEQELHQLSYKFLNDLHNRGN